MAFELTIALALLVFTFLYYFVVVRNSKTNKFLQKVPGPKQLPILGNSLDFNLPNDEITKLVQFKWPKEHGKRFAFAIGTNQYFTSSLPSDIEKLLSSSTQIDKGYEYSFIFDWLGDGLLLSRGGKWFKHRKMLTPSFHFKILEEFMPTFNEKSKIFVDILKKDSDGGKKNVEICQYITLCALDIICETAMGKTINAQNDRESAYVKAIYSVGASIQHRSLRPWLHPEFLWNLSPTGRQEKRNLSLLHHFTENVIQERKKEMAAAKDRNANRDEKKSEENDGVFMKKKRAIAFMDLLLEVQEANPADLTDHQIREETDTFMFEGHDTTSASLGWTVYLIGSHPEVQGKVLAELDSIFGDDKERPVTPADLAQMKYLEYCVKESLRLFPSVPFFARNLKQDLKLDDSLTIPSGFNFCVLSLNVHRNPDIFPDPEAFKPERFTPENSAGRHPYAYVPFSAGPRNCIGQKFALMEEKVILANLFRNFRIQSLDKREDVTIMMELITRPRDGFRVKLTPR